MISYSGIVGFGSGKATLPSVDTWGNNMNILRDPPKSIYTRKIDKVGETSEITQMIQDSGDRSCEAINVYARGVNPMVAVSYDNYGNNGGQRSGGIKTAGLLAGDSGNSGKQSFLPYRIMNNGAFRPPIRDQRDLLPLSRLPRTATSSFTQPGFADFSKKAMCHGTDKDTRGVKKPEEMLKTCIRPTATYQIKTPVIETYEVRNVIKNPIQISGNSGVNPVAKFNAEQGDVYTSIVDSPLKIDRNVNNSGEVSKKIDLNFDTERYTHEMLHGEIELNKGHNIQVTSIDEIYGINTTNNIKNSFNIDYNTPQTKSERQEYIHNDINLQRNLPNYQGTTNYGQNIYKGAGDLKNEREYTNNRPIASAFTNIVGIGGVIDDNPKEYRLKQTISPGGFEPKANLPMEYRENTIQEFDTSKTQMREKIYQMSQDRNMTIGNIEYRPREF